MPTEARELALAVMCAVFGCGWLAAEYEHRTLHAVSTRSVEGWSTCMTRSTERLDSLEARYRSYILPPTAAPVEGAWSVE